MDILVVIANIELSRIIGDVLHAEGHAVWEAPDARTAFRGLMSRLPDVVVVDARLPDIGGLDVLRALREAPGGDRVVAILLADDPASIASEARTLGVLGVLRKPVDVLDLSDLIQDATRHLMPTRLASVVSAPVVAATPVEVDGDPYTDVGHVQLSAEATDHLTLVPLRAQDRVALLYASGGDPWTLLGLPATASREDIEAAGERLISYYSDAARRERNLDTRARAASMVARVRAARRELLDPSGPMEGTG